MSRIMLVVVLLLLLPVFVTGASLEVPGARCSVQNCCAMAHCGEHEELGESHNCLLHGHHHHYHERIQLLFDAGMKPASSAAVAVLNAPQPFVFHLEGSIAGEIQTDEAPRPCPYPGYRRPLRC